MAGNNTGTNTWRDSKPAEWRYWMEWDRLQQELRGGVRPMEFTDMSERWGINRGNVHAIVGKAFSKCRTHLTTHFNTGTTPQ